MEKNTFISLSEANCGDNDSCRVNLDLPYGLGEKIELNVGKIDNLRQIGGFKSVFILPDNESGTSETVFQIDGINNDGTAIAKKASIKTVPKGSFDFQKETTFNRIDWPDLKIKINVEEIQKRIMDADKNLRDNLAWSKELNETIKSNILKGGTNHLCPTLGRMKIRDKMEFIYSYGAPFLLNNFKVDFGLIPQFLMISAIWNVANPLFYGGPEKKGKGYRNSLTFGPEMERAAILNLHGNFGAPIARAIPENHVKI